MNRVTLYTENGRRYNYRVRNSLLLSLLPNGRGERQKAIMSAVERLRCLVGLKTDKDPIEALSKHFYTDMATVITFALTFAAGIREANDPGCVVLVPQNQEEDQSDEE